MEIQAGRYNLSIMNFDWDMAQKTYTVLTNRAFQFTRPDNGAVLEIPAGSKVKFNYGWNVLEILVPSASGSIGG
jgi:hypothetical protein